MMILTIQTMGTFRPELSVHGDIVKIDLGPLLIEIDKEGFKNLLWDLGEQASENHLYIDKL